MKYWIDIDGNWLGGYTLGNQPAGAIEVPVPPLDARMIWNGTEWQFPPYLKWQFKQEAAQAELDATDRTATRAYEDNILWPQVWREYRNELRAIVRALVIGDYDSPLPDRPPFPEFDAAIPNLLTIEQLSTVTQIVHPLEGGTITVTVGSRDVMLAIEAVGALNELTIVLPPEATARLNQKVQFGTAYAIGKINWVGTSGDTVSILQAPSMLNAEESGTLQRSEVGVWLLAD